MSDRHLCKAKRTDNWQWVEGYYCKEKTGHYTEIGFVEEYKDCIITEFSVGGIIWCDVDPLTICQCTGLTDKNGKKIWENDILLLTDSESDDRDFYRVYRAPDGQWRCETAGHPAGEFSSCLEYLEVIGNMFDNPELLEGGTE